MEKKIFIQGEDIYLDYESDVSELNLNAELIHPDGFREDLVLPLMLNVSKVGTYNLEVNVSKEGYRDVFLSKQFAVIEKEVEVKEVNFSDEVDSDFKDEIFSKVEVEDSFLKKNILYILLGVFFVLVALFILFYFLYKKFG